MMLITLIINQPTVVIRSLIHTELDWISLLRRIRKSFYSRPIILQLDTGSGFTDGYTYIGPGMRPQSQKIYSETRFAGVMERFERIKMEIKKWEILTKSHVISPEVIN